MHYIRRSKLTSNQPRLYNIHYIPYIHYVPYIHRIAYTLANPNIAIITKSLPILRKPQYFLTNLMRWLTPIRIIFLIRNRTTARL